MANDFTARVAGISVELGMSVQNKSGIWCKPTVKMDLKIDGGTNPQQREAIIKQAFDEEWAWCADTPCSSSFSAGGTRRRGSHPGSPRCRRSAQRAAWPAG